MLPSLLDKSSSSRRKILDITHVIRDYNNLINTIDDEGKSPMIKFIEKISNSAKVVYDGIYNGIHKKMLKEKTENNHVLKQDFQPSK